MYLHSNRERTIYLAELQVIAEEEPGRRFPRHEIQCRARIRIGTRHYAGYIHNISRGGAKLRTITPIRKLGRVVLRLPDLPPLQCRLRWTDALQCRGRVRIGASARGIDPMDWIEVVKPAIAGMLDR